MERDEAETLVAANGHDPRHLDQSARFAFLQACQKGPLDLVEAFIVCGMPIRATTDREPAIIKAAESGKLEHVQRILAHGGSLETKDIAGDTALHTAANWGHTKLVEQLHAAGATPDTINGKKWTPLSKAIKDGKTEMIDVLLACGADPDYGRHANATPIAFSTNATLRKLLEAGAHAHLILDPVTEDTLLLARTGTGRLDDVKLLLKHGARDVPNRVGWTAAMVAGDRANPKPAIAALFDESAAGDTRLHAAAARGDVGELERLLEECPIDGVNRAGSTALLTACSKKQWDAARWLLNANADATIANVYANAPLTTAASNGQLELVRELLAAGAPANEGVVGEESPRSLALVLAANNAHLDVVRVLLDAGADIHSEDKFRQTPLFLAASRGHDTVVKLLLERGADPNRGGSATSPLLICVPKGHAKCVALLVDAGADLEKTEMFERTALHRVCDSYRNTKTELADILTSLVVAGADLTKLDTYANTPLMLAKSSKNQPVVERLERHLTEEFLQQHAGDWRAVVGAATSEHVRAFAQRGDVGTLRSMLDAGLDLAMLTTGPKPVFFDAIKLESAELAMLLVERGADVHVTRNGITALFYASSRGHLELMRTLLARGLDPNAVATDYKSTPLLYAVSAGQDDAAELLLQHGADPSPFRGGSSPLMSAAGRGNMNMVRKLLALGVDANVVNSQKQTALELARGKKHDDIVALLSTHTNTDLRDQAGRTALMRACVRGDGASVDHLLGVGADRTIADDAGDTPLIVAAWRAEIARRLGVEHVPFPASELELGDDPFRELRRRPSTSLDELPLVGAPNFRGDTALHIAVLMQSLPFAEHLLTQGADPMAENEAGECPMAIASVVARHVHKALKAAGHRTDPNRMALFMMNLEAFRGAIQAGDLREVNRLLDEKKVNPHLLGAQTPLGMAVGLDDDAMVRLLLDKGCDPLVPSGHQSLATRAARRGNTAILNRLLYAGVPPSGSAFREAMFAAQTGTMRILIEAGVELENLHLDDLSAESLRALVEVAWQHELGELAERATKRLRDIVAYG